MSSRKFPDSAILRVRHTRQANGRMEVSIIAEQADRLTIFQRPPNDVDFEGYAMRLVSEELQAARVPWPVASVLPCAAGSSCLCGRKSQKAESKPN